MTNIRIFILQKMLLEWLEFEFVGMCNMHRKTHSELQLENLKERENSGGTELDDSILLKWFVYMVSEC